MYGCRTTAPWPHPTEVFALTVGGKEVPLLLVAVMTFVLTSSCGRCRWRSVTDTREIAKSPSVVADYRAAGARSSRCSLRVDQADPRGGASLGNPLGAAQFGASFFMITGFHGTHVTIGVIFLVITAIKVARGDLENMRPGFMTGRKGGYEIVEILSLYWHFVDLVWVFISQSSTSGRKNHGTRARTATSDGDLCESLGLLFVLPQRLIRSATSMSRASGWFLLVVLMLLQAG